MSEVTEISPIQSRINHAKAELRRADHLIDSVGDLPTAIETMSAIVDAARLLAGIVQEQQREIERLKGAAK